MTAYFCIRTSFAGCDVSKKEMALAKKLTKPFKSLKVECSSDKSVNFTMDENEFRNLRHTFRDAHLDHLIEIEGEDYSVSWR